MSLTRLTIALNTNQSTKAPLLIPASTTSATALRNLVFRTAQSKLRLKKPTRVFAAGSGEELLSDEDWERIVGKNDRVLLVSAGEEYVGVKRKGDGRHGE